ncbi:MAG: TIGR01777 family protein [Calditrichaeota bacterium]|nr:TIGR01777 family protein [Calditrichota bacterium]
MKIIIAGASGFIGRHLVNRMLRERFDVIALSRNPERKRSVFPPDVKCLLWKAGDSSPWQDQLNEPAVIINLIGENLAARYWTKSYKKLLLSSRIESVETILQAIERVPTKGHTLIQASAVGYYGNTAATVDEQSPPGNDFLARLVVQWEKSSDPAEDLSVRRIITRFGLVLGKDGGALPKMMIPFKLFLGGPVGSGRQGVSWIHIKDVAEAVLFLIKNERLKGVFNLTAPQPTPQKEFSRVLGKALKRPSWLPVPGFLPGLVLGEMAKATVLSGQFAEPKALLKAGYSFRFEDLYSALKDILR